MTGVALITGGQQGIGLGIATALRDAGFRIALTSLPQPDSPVVVSALNTLGQDAAYFPHDVQDIDAVPRLVEVVEARMGPITTLVSNAGVPARVRGDMLDLVPQNFDFFVTSVSATMASVERAEYCISKAGAAMMAELFAVRMAAQGIGVFELRPGIIETEMTAGVKDKYTAHIEGGLVPAGRWGKPSDIGDIVVPLATGRMAFANGAVIPVDGGLSIPRL
jgi:NAD(P)-dependent dehydrogenase (short-subunit alcohol dehydrogenase family)